PTPRDKHAPPAAPVPPRQLRPEQVRRTIALVVDDLGLSFESTAYTRTALRKFVEQQMRPDDLVAIVRTSAGAGALQQFTSDKRQLLAAVERIRWNASFNNNVSAFAPLEGDPTSSMQSRRNNQSGQNNDNANANDELNNFREDVFAVGTLGALNYVVRGMRELPGRKSVVLLSEGFQLYRSSTNETNNRVLNALQRLTDLANRASVVIYTMDAHGLQRRARRRTAPRAAHARRAAFCRAHFALRVRRSASALDRALRQRREGRFVHARVDVFRCARSHLHRRTRWLAQIRR